MESAFPLDSLVLFFQSQVLLLFNWRFYQLLIFNSLSLFVEVGGTSKEGEAEAAWPPVRQGSARPPAVPHSRVHQAHAARPPISGPGSPRARTQASPLDRINFIATRLTAFLNCLPRPLTLLDVAVLETEP